MGKIRGRSSDIAHPEGAEQNEMILNHTMVLKESFNFVHGAENHLRCFEYMI